MEINKLIAFRYFQNEATCSGNLGKSSSGVINRVINNLDVWRNIYSTELIPVSIYW